MKALLSWPRNTLAHVHLNRKMRRTLIAAKRAGRRAMSPNPMNRIIAQHLRKEAQHAEAQEAEA